MTEKTDRNNDTNRKATPAAGSSGVPETKPPATVKEFLQRAAKPFSFLLLLILICAFLAQYLTGSETLQEYADNNPDLAYGPPGEPADAVPDAPPVLSSDSSSTKSEISAAEETPAVSSAYNIPEEPAPESADKAETDSTTVSEVDDTMNPNPERTSYQDGFYYEPLSETIKQRITGISYPETGCTVPYEDLNYVGLLYIDFDGEVQEGELICNKAIAQDMVEIFYELYRNEYRFERIRLIDEYGGDDTLSMLDNNTSCFNYRVVDGTTSLSKHALGCAIDINPFYNPYVVFNRNGSGETYISPKGSEIYADRSQNFPYKIDENDLCYKLFTEHGFTWGGNWNSSKDYQHFQIVLPQK